MRYKKCKFRRNWSATMATLPYRSKQFFCPCLALHRRAVTETSFGTPCTCATSCQKLGRNQSAMKNPLLFSSKQFFVLTSPCIAVGWLTHDMWPYLYLCYKQYKFGCNWSVMKGTLILKPTQFFLPISPLIAVEWLKHHITLSPHALSTSL